MHPRASEGIKMAAEEYRSVRIQVRMKTKHKSGRSVEESHL